MRSKIWLKTGLVILFVVILATPTLARTAYHYRGIYQPAAVRRPDMAAINLPSLDKTPFVETDLKQRTGRVIVDRAHDNSLGDLDLNVLSARLAARGLHLYNWGKKDALADLLLDAVGLVVAVPHRAFTADEVQMVAQFVERGGRVLLIGDPSRYAFKTVTDEYGYEMYVIDSDTASLNSLAARFGLTFSDDYVYNTSQHAGNYQYVMLNRFAEHALTTGLEQVIWYAAHSIASTGQALISADEQTTSSLSEQTGGLTMMSLDEQGRVLAVADLTFMTEPYNTAADNNRLIANMADFLAGSERLYGLTDFPLFLRDEVGVTAMTDMAQDQSVGRTQVEYMTLLKNALEQAGKKLVWQQASSKQDTIYVGVYNDIEFWPEVADILAEQGITLTLETAASERATPTPTPRYNTPTPTPTPKNAPSPTPTPTPKPPRDWVHVAGRGRLDARQVTVFYQNEENDRQVLMILTFDPQNITDAVQRLISRQFSDCIIDQDLQRNPDLISLAICPAAQKAGPTPTPAPSEATPTATPAASGSILLVSDDDGEGTYDWWTSVYDFAEAAADAGYEVEVWSTGWDGDVTLEQLQNYQAVIWCTGDYKETESNPELDDLDILTEYLDGGGRLILEGAFLGSVDTESGLLLDVLVTAADHPLTKGFAQDQVIVLERLSASEEYEAFVLQDGSAEDIPFVRGPDSQSAGAPLVIVDDYNDYLLLIGFPIYLLPEQERYQFAWNAVTWLMQD